MSNRMKNDEEKCRKSALYTFCRHWAVTRAVVWPPTSTARLLLFLRHSARRFSTRHNFSDITPIQVIQKPKLIYSTSSTTFTKNLKPNSNHNLMQNTNKFELRFSDLQKCITLSILSQMRRFKCLNSSTWRELQLFAKIKGWKWCLKLSGSHPSSLNRSN